jgi:hypothetical protein
LIGEKLLLEIAALKAKGGPEVRKLSMEIEGLKQLLANIRWRQECAAAIGLGFTLPANSQEAVMDKFGQVFGTEELEAVSL